MKQLARSISEAFQKKGFRSIEVISPCPTIYQRRHRLGDRFDTMKHYKEQSRVKHGAPTSEVGLTMTGEIIVGKFVDRDRPTVKACCTPRCWSRSASAMWNPRRMYAAAAN